MSVKINRYPASEGGNWSINGRNVMTIKVPDVGFADLHNSYVVFRVEPKVQVIDNNGVIIEDPIIYPMVFADVGPVGTVYNATDGETVFSPCTGQSLIRNCRVQYSRAQIQNERIDQNVFSQNMDWYTTTRANQRCSANLSGACNINYGTIGASGLPDTPFFQYSRPNTLYGGGGANATALSQTRNADILIPLKHIDQLADGMRQFPMVAFGETQYNIQLENVFNVVSAAQMPFIPFDNIVVPAGPGNVSIGSADIPIILTEVFATQLRLNDIPIFVGASMNISYQVENADQLVGVVIIASVMALANGRVGVTFVNPRNTISNANDVIQVALTYVGYFPDVDSSQAVGYPDTRSTQENNYGAVASWNITNAYVELHELKLTTDQQKLALSAMRNMQLPFVQYQTVRKNMLLTATEYCDTVPYDVGCMGLVVMTPQPNKMTSGFDNASQYRYKINSRDELGRWVIIGPEQETRDSLPVGRQLHNYKLESLFSGLGKTLKKYDAPAFNYQNYNDRNTHAILPLEIYDNAQNGVVSINLQAGDQNIYPEMQAKTVYWQFLYQKAVVIKNGQVVGVI